MSKERLFYWKKSVETDFSIELIVLGFTGGGSPADAMECCIAPAYGSNLCRFTAGGRSVIDYDPEVLVKRDYTGTPVLYPTPNRVRNGMFMYRGSMYNQVKRGEPVFEHGLVHNEPWCYSEPEVKNDSVVFHTWIDSDENSALFEAFPFKHTLELEFTLDREGVRVAYSISNHGEAEIPFGFGLHPYFMKLSGEEDTMVCLPVQAVMDYTSDLLPTGKLIDIEGTIYDLRSPTRIGALDLDHVFTGVEKGKYAAVEYKTLGTSVILETSEDFSHQVLYSPRGKEYFCLENQTCSTDAHNLYDRGFVRESGLKTVSRGEVHRGFVKYHIRKG